MKQAEDSGDETATVGRLLRSVDRDEDVSTSTAVIEAVAAVSDSDATELPPLYDSIDPNGLNVLFDSDGAHSDQPIGVSFTYLEYRVHVDRERIEIRSATDDVDASS